MADDLQLVKQEENRPCGPNNPTGIGGFQNHPELINKNGRPPKGSSWAEILIEIGEEVEPTSGHSFKRKVAKRLWWSAANGNVQAMKELFDRMDGKPVQLAPIINTTGEFSLSR